MDVLKPFWWNSKFSYRRDYMALDFGLLTGYAFAGPFAYVLLYVGPDKFFSDGLPSSLYPWVTEAMNDVEDTTPVGEGYEWACRSVRDVYK